mgnify:CR=1 FL=1
MATGLVNGTDLLLRVGTTGANEDIIAYSTSCSLEISMDEIDQTSKDSAGWKSIIGGTRSWSVSSDALYANESQTNEDFRSLFDLLGGATNGRSKIYIELAVSDASSGNVFYSGGGYVTSLSVNGGTEDQSSFSVTITGDGVLQETEI